MCFSFIVISTFLLGLCTPGACLSLHISFINLQVLNMSSSRNMAIIGISVMIGIMVPTYIKETKNPISSGTLESNIG